MDINTNSYSSLPGKLQCPHTMVSILTLNYHSSSEDSKSESSSAASKTRDSYIFSVRHRMASVYSGVEFVISSSSSSSHFYSIRPTLFSRIELSWSSLRLAIWLSPISIGIGSAMNPHKQLPHWITFAIDVPNIWSSLLSSSLCSSFEEEPL